MRSAAAITAAHASGYFVRNAPVQPSRSEAEKKNGARCCRSHSASTDSAPAALTIERAVTMCGKRFDHGRRRQCAAISTALFIRYDGGRFDARCARSMNSAVVTKRAFTTVDVGADPFVGPGADTQVRPYVTVDVGADPFVGPPADTQVRPYVRACAQSRLLEECLDHLGDTFCCVTVPEFRNAQRRGRVERLFNACNDVRT